MSFSNASGLTADHHSDPDRPAVSDRRLGQPRKTGVGRYLMIAWTAVIGSFASIALFITITSWQNHLASLRFTSTARSQLQTMNSVLEDATGLLLSMRAYFESLDHRVSGTEYQAFSRSLRERVVGLRDTGWAPRVAAAERAGFERAIRAAGEPDFEIRERNADGRLVRAGDRNEYFPIIYSDPGAINRSILGFDLASEPMRNRAIARARANNRPAATPPLKLMNVQRPNGGVMSFIAVRNPAAPTSDAPATVAGVVLGAFETEPMIANILASKLPMDTLEIYVFDPTGPPGTRLIYWHSATGKPFPAEASLLAGRHWQSTLDLVDQHWGIIFAPSDKFDEAVQNWTAFAVLAGGLTFTGSIVFYLWLTVCRTRQLERLTASLRETGEELRHRGARLAYLARHDTLTGLPNRMGFRDNVANELQQTRRGSGLALLYLDLDRFKAVNDTLGHSAGDRLLCDVADRLRESVREVDSITRLGGDEFAIALTASEPARITEALAARIIDAVSRPYTINGQLVVVGVSIGIALADNDDADVDLLLRQADMALYAAKRNGRGTWRFFEPAMEFDAQTRSGLELDLRNALERDELELYYQPKISLADGQVRGLEALLRWNNPDRGLVMPGDFIQCAEETGLIMPIGAWVLHTALREAANWPACVRVAVNLSAYQLARDDLAEAVEAALADAGQPGARLELEITENALIEHCAAGQATLKRLRASGVRISIDDFGTGYASLRHLRSFTFDRIKIDQSLIAGITESAEGGAIVRAILNFAASLNLATVAEGVETRAQLDQLIASGCTEAQGLLFSPARRRIEVPRLLAGWPSAPRDVPPGVETASGETVPQYMISVGSD
jgi:diguanylate cyclase (GGDEF)-like protein